MQTLTLNNGVEMPVLGYGVFQIPEAETEQAVAAALNAGYRLVDTAAIYGNEAAVGRAIANSGVPREELFVTTKLWIGDAGPGKTPAAFERSLERLGLDYLDLYLIHQPYGDCHGAWREMEQLYRDGRVRAIGVSNFHPDRLMDLMAHNQIVPAVNQIETHPFHQRVADHRFMRAHGVQVEAWGPFAQGKNHIFTHPVLVPIAEAHGVSTSQVIIRWLIQRGIVAIPKSVTPERIRRNMDVFGFELTTAQMEAIATLDNGTSLFIDHRSPEAVERLSSYRVP